MLEKSTVTADQLDFIIVATKRPDTATPAEANRLLPALNANHAFAFNLNVACAGLAYALHVAARQQPSPTVHLRLELGSVLLSRLVAWQARRTAVLFAAGAGGVLVRALRAPVLPVALCSFGALEMVLLAGELPNHAPFADALPQPSPYFKKHGRAVTQFAISVHSRSINRALELPNQPTEAIAWFLLHLPNARIVQSEHKC